MNKMKKTVAAAAILFGTCVAPVAALTSCAQEIVGADGQAVDQSALPSAKKGTSFLKVVYNPDDPDVLGLFLWIAIFADLGLAIYFASDCFILIKPEKLMPQKLLNNIQAAMSEGDVVKAMEACQNDPSAMSSIVMAAFQHIEEGFEAIQEAVTAASDLEQEKIQQRLNWISICGNLGPSLGLLGTVEGMILTFNNLASGGAGDAAALAGSIGQALWTTAFGLIISIPSIAMFYTLRNKANRLILKMTALTMEILNSLRNVSVDAPAEEMVQA